MIGRETSRKQLDGIVSTVPIGNNDFQVWVVDSGDIGDDTVKETSRLKKRDRNGNQRHLGRGHASPDGVQKLLGKERSTGKFARIDRIISVIRLHPDVEPFVKLALWIADVALAP